VYHRKRGTQFPVEIRHDERPAGDAIEDAMAKAIRRGASRRQTGSVLAFLPGQREIERTAERLEGRLSGRAVDIVPLYGSSTARRRTRRSSRRRPARRKVVLATSIAETSITIDGVRVVIDSGLARLPVLRAGDGLTRLETVRASRASADQRAGRAGKDRARASPSGCGAPSRRRPCPPSRRRRSCPGDLSGFVLDLRRLRRCRPGLRSPFSTRRRRRRLSRGEGAAARGSSAIDATGA
jgi:ATP-dependent helicase HrpB